MRDLLQAGVHGYILKDDDYVSQIDTIIRDMAGGEIYLSPQAYAALAKATRSEGERTGALRTRNRGAAPGKTRPAEPSNCPGPAYLARHGAQSPQRHLPQTGCAHPL